MNPLFTFNRFLPTVLVFGTVGGILLILFNHLFDKGQLAIIPFPLMLILAFLMYRPDTEKQFRPFFVMGIAVFVIMSLFILGSVLMVQRGIGGVPIQTILIATAIIIGSATASSFFLSALVTSKARKPWFSFQSFLAGGMFWGVLGGTVTVLSTRLVAAPGLMIMICMASLTAFYLTFRSRQDSYLNYFFGGLLTFLLSFSIYFLGGSLISLGSLPRPAYVGEIILALVLIGGAICALLSALVNKYKQSGR